MESMNSPVCPVCTLFLRPGITLESHLASHPKQKVIEALIKVSQLTPTCFDKLLNNNSGESPTQYPQLQVSATPSWNHATPMNVQTVAPNLNQVPTNHSFIYQQFMSSSGTQPIMNVNPIAQQFVAVPTVINPQMFCSPYVFQQQQQLQIVTTNPSLQPILSRPPLGLLNSELSITATNIANETATQTTKQSNIPISSETVICDEKLDETNQNNVEETGESCKDESVQVYPLYPEVIMGEDYERSETPEITILIEKPCETSDNAEQTEIANEVEIVETIEIPKVDNEVTITIENDEVGDMPVLIPKPQSGQWKRKQQEEELDKACQTQMPVFENVCCETKKNSSVEYISEADDHNEVQMLDNHVDQVYKVTTVPSSQMRVESIYTVSKTDSMPSSSSIMMPNQNVTLLEIDDVNFMITNDFIETGKTILSKVEDYECIKESDGNKIIMNIGEERCNLDTDQKDIKKFCDDKLGEESISHESLNIHADERMPPRGELSEQESNGASDIHSWGKVYHEQECSSGMSTSYDLLARESWEASDCSDSEMPPLQSRIPPSTMYVDKEPELITSLRKTPNVSYSCTTCDESFSCPKERRVHQSKEHGTSSSSSLKKTIKIRQARKPKQMVIKEENNFDIFAKTEPLDEPPEEIEPTSPIKLENDEAQVPLDIKPITRLADDHLCNMCGELFRSAKDFNKHLQKVHKILNDKHKCKTCLVQFPSEGKFTEHLKIHPLECNICGKNFYRRYNLYIHLKRHYNIRPHKCEVCAKAFLTRQKLQEHTNVHTRVAPIKCTMCDETFRRHSNLVQHRNKHHFNIKKKYKDYVCHCGEVFHSKNKLNWHKEIHDTKPKSCMYCHEKFIHMSSLTRHIRRSHNQNYVPNGKKDTENVECHICKGIYFKSSLDVHLQTHSGRRQHACLICGKEFTTKWNLKLHRWTHASRTSKPFKCDQCNGAFIRQSDYQAHINSHKSVRPYTCNYCGCKFIRKYNCQRHVREHEENKAYTCTVCNKSFHRSYYLKEHMRVHSGARPFSCHICGKTSTTKSNHNKHMKIHHAREPVSTEG